VFLKKDFNNNNNNNEDNDNELIDPKLILYFERKETLDKAKMHFQHEKESLLNVLKTREVVLTEGQLATPSNLRTQVPPPNLNNEASRGLIYRDSDFSEDNSNSILHVNDYQDQKLKDNMKLFKQKKSPNIKPPEKKKNSQLKKKPNVPLKVVLMKKFQFLCFVLDIF